MHGQRSYTSIFLWTILLLCRTRTWFSKTHMRVACHHERAIWVRLIDTCSIDPSISWAGKSTSKCAESCENKQRIRILKGKEGAYMVWLNCCQLHHRSRSLPATGTGRDLCIGFGSYSYSYLQTKLSRGFLQTWSGLQNVWRKAGFVVCFAIIVSARTCVSATVQKVRHSEQTCSSSKQMGITDTSQGSHSEQTCSSSKQMGITDTSQGSHWQCPPILLFRGFLFWKCYSWRNKSYIIDLCGSLHESVLLVFMVFYVVVRRTTS
jgi:hypothetical protein